MSCMDDGSLGRSRSRYCRSNVGRSRRGDTGRPFAIKQKPDANRFQRSLERGEVVLDWHAPSFLEVADGREGNACLLGQIVL